MGVLIHQPEEGLGQVIDEIVRCASRFVLAGEYLPHVQKRFAIMALVARSSGGTAATSTNSVVWSMRASLAEVTAGMI